jgi:hypothetical protein
VPELDGVIEAAGRVVESARTHADPICADVNLSVEGRVAKVAEADAAAVAEYARLEEKVREARAAASEAAAGVSIDADAAAVATAEQRLQRLRSDGASHDQILKRAVDVGDRAMLVALRQDLGYHAAHLSDADRAAVAAQGGTRQYEAMLAEAETPYLSDEGRAAREALAEADEAIGAIESGRLLLDALTSRQVKQFHVRGGEPEQHLVPNQARVNHATLAAAYGGA